MTVDEALSQYIVFGNDVFGQARWWHERSILYFPRAKYPSRKVRIAIIKAIHAKLQQRNPDTTIYQAKHELFRSREDQTRTYVFAF